MTKEELKELLIERIKEERKVLKECKCDDEESRRVQIEQFGYVCGLEHALRLVEIYAE